jgi:2'-5' RNA ligase
MSPHAIFGLPLVCLVSEDTPSMPLTRNLFFALAPDPSLRDALAAHAQRLHAGWGGRMTAPAKLHMTLLFLDALPAPIEPTLIEAARAAGASIALPGFELVVDRADRFGHRVGWLGCSHVPPALQALHERLLDACFANGAPVQRENHYTPHVTISRDPRTPAPHAIDPLPWRVRDFALMASAEGAYEILGRWSLQS